jgi:hypothetical protein
LFNFKWSFFLHNLSATRRSQVPPLFSKEQDFLIKKWGIFGLFVDDKGLLGASWSRKLVCVAYIFLTLAKSLFSFADTAFFNSKPEYDRWAWRTANGV